MGTSVMLSHVRASERGEERRGAVGGVIFLTEVNCRFDVLGTSGVHDVGGIPCRTAW